MDRITTSLEPLPDMPQNLVSWYCCSVADPIPVASVDYLLERTTKFLLETGSMALACKAP